jgi:hypothetical protein
MSFKVSNVRFEESRRVFDEESSSKLVEEIRAAATSDPYKATTKIFANTSYSITLPNARPGTIKVMTLVADGETNVIVNYNNGYSGNATSVTFSYLGDLVIFYASARGWHMNNYIYD